jgi:asparagine synthase (glutamine-hydrolysing)
MSGILGIIDPRGELRLEALIDNMVKAMSYRPWYTAQTMVDRENHLALGRMGIGIFNTGSQPIWNAAHTVALLMSGEFSGMEAGSFSEEKLSDEALALKLYEQYREDFVKHLKGAFLVAIWDMNCQRILVANDRFGLYPLYYSHRSGRLIFSPEVKGILCDDSFPKKLDITALAQFMRFSFLLGDRTHFEGIKVLPNASLLVYDLPEDSLTIQKYWDYNNIPYYPDIEFDEAVEEAGRLFRRAVERMSGDHYRPGVYLSGGLDSRSIIGMIRRRPLPSITYGVRDCRDVVYARRIAKTVGSDHHWFDQADGSWAKENADFHLDLTEGFHSWIHMQGINTLPYARQWMDVILTGWDGGTVFADKDESNPLLFSPVDDEARDIYFFDAFNQVYTWPSMTENEERLLYCAPLWKQLAGVAFDSFREELARYSIYRREMQWKYFYLDMDAFRLTRNMITIARSHIEVRFPFFDYDLFDFLYSLPHMWRGTKILYRSMIQKEMPRLAYIPYERDELLPTTRPVIRKAHTLSVNFRHRFNRHLFPLFKQYRDTYADYAGYVRNGLRGWAEEILSDPRTAERGIFNPAFLSSLMKRHLANNEGITIGKLAIVMTYEMMLRRFFDT